MFNKKIINQIIEACEQYQKKQTSIANLQALIEANGAALEKPEKELLEILRNQSNELEKIQYFYMLQDTEEYERVSSICSKLKQCLLDYMQGK